MYLSISSLFIFFFVLMSKLINDLTNENETEGFKCGGFRCLCSAALMGGSEKIKKKKTFIKLSISKNSS